jgi:predicted PurR-regulated permease PerM
VSDGTVATGGSLVPADDPTGAAALRGNDLPPPTSRMSVVLEPRGVWRAGWVVLALLGIALFLDFVLEDGGSVIFNVLIAWFASIAMEPAVSRLSKRMKRGAATLLVMLGVALFCVLFGIAFGKLIADQLIQAVKAIPGFANSALGWVNDRLGTDYSPQEALNAVGITQETLTNWAKELAGGALGFVVSVLGAIFSSFTFLLFTFYLSADAPRLKRWVARLFPTRYQPVVVTVWDLSVEKTGGYVAARVVLAAINGGTTAIFLFIIGMPYWLILGIWTGLVAQFVPTIGTYISIILPVLVGLLGPHPIQGVLALAWAIVYQQVENLTLEPQISAKAVDIHPAVSFGAVLLGAALFGAAGAVLAVPVAALLLALLDIYARKYELLPSLRPPGAPPPPPPKEESSTPLRRGQRWMKGLFSRDDKDGKDGGSAAGGGATTGDPDVAVPDQSRS